MRMDWAASKGPIHHIMTYDNLVDLYGMKEMLANDTPFGMNRVELFNLYLEFAFIGFIVLMALLLKDLWEKK